MTHRHIVHFLGDGSIDVIEAGFDTHFDVVITFLDWEDSSTVRVFRNESLTKGGYDSGRELYVVPPYSELERLCREFMASQDLSIDLESRIDQIKRDLKYISRFNPADDDVMSSREYDWSFSCYVSSLNETVNLWTADRTGLLNRLSLLLTDCENRFASFPSPKDLLSAIREKVSTHE